MILNKSMNRRFSFFIAIFCCLSLITPVYANSDTDSEYTQQSTFWHWYAGAGKSLNEFIGYTFGYVCAVSEDGYHHASSTLGVHTMIVFVHTVEKISPPMLPTLSRATRTR